MRGLACSPTETHEAMTFPLRWKSSLIWEASLLCFASLPSVLIDKRWGTASTFLVWINDKHFGQQTLCLRSLLQRVGDLVSDLGLLTVWVRSEGWGGTLPPAIQKVNLASGRKMCFQESGLCQPQRGAVARRGWGGCPKCLEKVFIPWACVTKEKRQWAVSPCPSADVGLKDTAVDNGFLTAPLIKIHRAQTPLAG